jgi:DNA-directed RNA polymerase subunit RPC12/RpoP
MPQQLKNICLDCGKYFDKPVGDSSSKNRKVKICPYCFSNNIQKTKRFENNHNKE